MMVMHNQSEWGVASRRLPAHDVQMYLLLLLRIADNVPTQPVYMHA